MRFLARIKAVGFAHQGAGTNQEVAKPGARANAGVAVVRGVAVGQVARMLPFAGIKHAVPGHEHLVEHHHAGALAVLAAEQRLAMLDLFAGPPGRARNDGDAGRIDRHGAADGKVRVLAAHVAAWHDQEFMHIRRAGHDGLGARDDDAFGIAFDDMQVAVDVRLLVRAPAAVALGVGHGDAQRQVLVLHAVQVIEKAGGVLGGAARVVDTGGHLADGVECVVRQVTLGAAGFLANQPHRFKLVQQVTAAGVDVRQPVDALAAGVLHGGHEGRVLFFQRVVVGQRNRIDAGAEAALVGHAVHRPAVQENARLVASQ